jgi:hypothetical protein
MLLPSQSIALVLTLAAPTNRDSFKVHVWYRMAANGPETVCSAKKRLMAVRFLVGLHRPGESDALERRG